LILGSPLKAESSLNPGAPILGKPGSFGGALSVVGVSSSMAEVDMSASCTFETPRTGLLPVPTPLLAAGVEAPHKGLGCALVEDDAKAFPKVEGKVAGLGELAGAPSTDFCCGWPRAENGDAAEVVVAAEKEPNPLLPLLLLKLEKGEAEVVLPNGFEGRLKVPLLPPGWSAVPQGDCGFAKPAEPNVAPVAPRVVLEPKAGLPNAGETPVFAETPHRDCFAPGVELAPKLAAGILLAPKPPLILVAAPNAGVAALPKEPPDN